MNKSGIPTRSPDDVTATKAWDGGIDVLVEWCFRGPRMKKSRIHLTDSMAEHFARTLIRALKSKRDDVARSVASLREEAS